MCTLQLEFVSLHLVLSFFVKNETVKRICTTNLPLWEKTDKETNLHNSNQEDAILKSQAVCCKSVHVSVTALHMLFLLRLEKTQKPQHCMCAV